MPSKRIGIIGCGPRGLVALEAIIDRLATRESEHPLVLEIFEAGKKPGSGPNYDPDQIDSNLINIPLREMPIGARTAVDGTLAYDEFPSFIRWYEFTEAADAVPAVDHFPPRAVVGEYLQARLYSILNHVRNKNCVVLHESTTVLSVDRNGNHWTVSAEPRTDAAQFDEILLCIGHQEAESHGALKHWQGARQLHRSPYPCEAIVEADQIDHKSTVALRGMGLSMIDVVKALTIGRGGSFQIKERASRHLAYLASGLEPALMVPFSLDGQPMAPKPMNKSLDDRFKPTLAAMKVCELALDFTKGNPVDLRALLIEQVVLHTPAVFLSLYADMDGRADHIPDQEHVQNAARRWLMDETYTHPLIVDASAPTAFIMQQFLDMATGQRPPSLDYIIGQIWRHLQPTFYRTLRFQNFDGDVIEAALSLDARMKRYAFGPPADSIAQLLALYEAKLLKFCIADDPEVRLDREGWALSEGDETVKAQVMINTVLDPVTLTTIDTPLVRHLRAQGLVCVVHDNLGARANSSGQLLSKARVKGSLSACGRLVTGSIVEADALLNCFGDELYFWADAALDRLSFNR